MLKTRILTAAVLLAILLPILFFMSPMYWFGMTLIFIAAAAWEWARLARARYPLLDAFLTLSLGIIWLIFYMHNKWSTHASIIVYLLAAFFWVILVPYWLWKHTKVGAYRGLNVLVLLIAWMALVEARQQGIVFMLSIMLLVWLADIGAYFIGKAYGQHKLAPVISPGKTWEGAFGGLVISGIVLISLAKSNIGDTTFFAGLLHQYGWLWMSLFFVLLVALSIEGDLFESFIKRQAGVKDSSQLLPGHGGVMDRIDALLPVVPLAMLGHLGGQW